MDRLKRFGQKAHTFITRPVADDKPMTILEGSIRSSKTFAVMAKLLPLCRYKVGGQRVITGVSKNTIYQNVLLDLFELVGRRNYRYNRQAGELTLFGVRWIVIGAKDEGSEKLIRGMTIGVAYSDEVALMPKSFFLQLMARMSPDGARFYGTTNPDNPYHYLKTEYIENPELVNDLEVIHFTLDDNPNLSRRTRERYERMYTGVFYRRFILGLWVIAEGAIYRDSLTDSTWYTDADRPIGLLQRPAARYIGVDYGTTNPCVFLDVYDDGRTMWQEKEYYWDSKKEFRQKTDQEYADDLELFAGPDRRGLVVVVDPSASSFKVELVKRGFLVKNAVNDVSPGLRRTAAALRSGMYQVHTRCVHTKRELQTYAWNEKAAKRGEEEPIKQNDHAPDAVRYTVHTMLPTWRLP